MADAPRGQRAVELCCRQACDRRVVCSGSETPSRYNRPVNERPSRHLPPRLPARVTRPVARVALVEAVASERDVVAAYLFGSVAAGDAGPLSDVDIGVLLAEGVDEDEVCGRLMDGLCRRLHTDRIDVVSLGRSPLPLRYRILRDGTLVLCRDAAAREAFTVATVMDYLDFKPVRDLAFARMRDAILKEG